jgi:hypothetical protein
VTSNQRTTGDIRGQCRVQSCRQYDFPRRPALLESQPIETVRLEKHAAQLRRK